MQLKTLQTVKFLNTCSWVIMLSKTLESSPPSSDDETEEIVPTTDFVKAKACFDFIRNQFETAGIAFDFEQLGNKIDDVLEYQNYTPNT
jgi:hypothetical protein